MEFCVSVKTIADVGWDSGASTGYLVDQLEMSINWRIDKWYHKAQWTFERQTPCQNENTGLQTMKQILLLYSAI